MAQISLTFPDGNARAFASGITPAEVAADISTSLGKKAISATVDGDHWDAGVLWPWRCAVYYRVTESAGSVPRCCAHGVPGVPGAVHDRGA